MRRLDKNVPCLTRMWISNLCQRIVEAMSRSRAEGDGPHQMMLQLISVAPESCRHQRTCPHTCYLQASKPMTTSDAGQVREIETFCTKLLSLQEEEYA